MHRLRSIAVLGAVAVTALLVGPAPASTADANVESAVLAKIRAGRSGGLIVHSGLLSAARAHSMYMSRHGMSHANADARVRNAAPDPFETNGAPDDGFGVATWCENVTYSTGHPASEVSDRIYSQWAGSGAHGRCMRDTSRNVGAVGVYYDGSTWWATFIAQVDSTPPGGSTSEKTSAPKPPPAAASEPPPPAATAAPVPATASEPVTGTAPAAQAGTAAEAAERTDRTPTEAAVEEPAEAPVIAGAVSADGSLRIDDPFPAAATSGRTSRSNAYAWQDLAAVAGILAIATLLLLRRVRASAPLYVPPDLTAEVERRHRVALPEVELVGAGTVHA